MTWYRERAALRLILGGYLPSFAALNLAWEIAQLPLYTIWREASAGTIAFAVAHCTAGDILIGGAALVLALLATRAGAPQRWNWLALGVIATAIGVSYTLFSEWINTSVRASWSYSTLMPTLEVHGVLIGLAPLAQWLILPPLALYLGARSAGRRSRR
jgi:hypothetical protein